MFDLQGLNLYLIGMMGSGKSTIGALIAERLEYRFVDTDTSIEQSVGQSVAEIFQTSGEAEFRQCETNVLAKIAADKGQVIATGGGIAIKKENWDYLKHGLVIWLDVSVDILVERLKGDTSRPIINRSSPTQLQSKLEQILIERREHYAVAELHLPITSDLPPMEIVDRILTLLATRSNHNV